VPDPSTYRPAPGTIPDGPGVYRFRDPSGRVVYVGKAKSLRQRLHSYFGDLAALHPRTQQMVTTAGSVEWTVVANEVEALQLEYAWIKEYDPRFNVRYRDDKSYPYLAVTISDEFPRALVYRGPRRKGVRYFGPYAHAWAIRETVDLMLRAFPMRTCSSGVFRRAERSGRPCLLGYIGKCAAPCVGRVSAEEHRALVEGFCDFVAGRTGPVLKRLEREMRAAAAAQDYERAARLRDDLGALTRALERSAVVLPDATDADVVAVAEDDLEAAVQVFHVRGGRVRGQRGFVTERVEDLGTGDLVEHLLQQLYGGEGADVVPREVLVPALPPDQAALERWLAERRGSAVSVRVPQRGDKRALLDTVTRNAVQSLGLHKLRRAGDLSARSRALAELQEALDLPVAPLRIEAFDISNLQGTEVVASMVVFEDGLARKSEYRRFAVKGAVGADGVARTDDVASMREVVGRRFRRYLDEREQSSDLDLGDAETAGDPGPGAPPRDKGGRPRRFAYAPNLLLVDGGAAQVAAAQAALDELGIDDVSLVGLAKRLEEVWRPGSPDPVILPRTSEGLYLLQRVRDEAHRFAIAYHRSKRSKSMTSSALDDVPGVGPARRALLLRHFGSLKRLRAASAEEIASLPGFGEATARAVVSALAASERPTPAVNPATGEIMDDDGAAPGSSGQPEEEST
jgi:excinuclease ABC subunit C